MSSVFEQPDRFGGRGDAVYAGLVAAHDGLSEAESAALNARLILLLAHLVGDPDRIAEAVRLARESVRSGEARSSATTAAATAER